MNGKKIVYVPFDNASGLFVKTELNKRNTSIQALGKIHNEIYYSVCFNFLGKQSVFRRHIPCLEHLY